MSSASSPPPSGREGQREYSVCAQLRRARAARDCRSQESRTAMPYRYRCDLAQLTPVQRDRNRRYVGPLRADGYGLASSARGQRQVGGEVLACRRSLDVIARGTSCNRPGSVAAGFTPRAGDCTAMVLNLAREIEIIALACAFQIQSKLGAAAGDIVGCPAAQPL